MKKTKGTPRKKGSIIERVLHLAFELSQNKWKLGFSDGNKMRFKSIAARNLEQLHEEVEKAQVRFKLRGNVRILSCYEAGRDDFQWRLCRAFLIFRLRLNTAPANFRGFSVVSVS